jgi:hypothetical protein
LHFRKAPIGAKGVVDTTENSLTVFAIPPDIISLAMIPETPGALPHEIIGSGQHSPFAPRGHNLVLAE